MPPSRQPEARGIQPTPAARLLPGADCVRSSTQDPGKAFLVSLIESLRGYGRPNFPLRAESRNSIHSACVNDSTDPSGSRDCRTRTDSSTNATSTQLPAPDAVLFRHTMPARSKSATLPPPLGSRTLPRRRGKGCRARRRLRINQRHGSHGQGGSRDWVGKWMSDTHLTPRAGSAKQQSRRYKAIRPQPRL